MGRKKLGQWTLWGGNSLPNIVQIAFDHETLCRYDNLKASHHSNCKCTKFLFSYTLWTCMLPGWVMLYNIIYIHSGGKRLTCRAPCSANLGLATCFCLRAGHPSRLQSLTPALKRLHQPELEEVSARQSLSWWCQQRHATMTRIFC